MLSRGSKKEAKGKRTTLASPERRDQRERKGHGPG